MDKVYHDLLNIYKELKAHSDKLYNIEDNQKLIETVNYYKNYFNQFIQIIDDNKKSLDNKCYEIINLALDLNKHIEKLLEHKKTLLNDEIKKKGTKSNIIKSYYGTKKRKSFFDKKM
ncbi:MAG: hypothetical protein SVN78_00530 [Deferribacterota bacterium]|nr:hypothetical protein [Deferribacterota bacterium]